jgi:hypothetical protein
MWRRCIGIEPIRDITHAPRTVLKTEKEEGTTQHPTYTLLLSHQAVRIDSPGFVFENGD